MFKVTQSSPNVRLKWKWNKSERQTSPNPQQRTAYVGLPCYAEGKNTPRPHEFQVGFSLLWLKAYPGLT